MLTPGSLVMHHAGENMIPVQGRVLFGTTAGVVGQYLYAHLI